MELPLGLANRFDPEGLAEKGLSLLNVSPDMSILIGLLPFALGFTILFTRFSPEEYKTTSVSIANPTGVSVLHNCFIPGVLHWVFLLSLVFVRQHSFQTRLPKPVSASLKSRGYDNIKEISNEEYDFTADKDGESMRIDFVVEDEELFIQELNNTSVTPTK